uniref:Uncharacterized protein n=1 Tax=Fagus sylvatica TaxID=28930 RepID=A0A2N9FAX4_FAGSY
MAKNKSSRLSSACHHLPPTSLITTTYGGGFWLGEFEDGVGFEFMVLWIDFLGEPMWDWCCVRIKTMEIIDLWSKSQEAHGFGGIWLWVLPSVVDVVVTVVFEPLCVL